MAAEPGSETTEEKAVAAGAMVVEHVIPEPVHHGGAGLAPGMTAGQEPESSGSESESMTMGSGSESGGTTESSDGQ